MTRGRLARLGRAVFLPTTCTAAAPVRLRSPADVLALLEAETARVRADSAADPVARARAVGTLARVALSAIEADQMAARVAALEAVLARRRPA
ncbi:hypothetical protein [Urbifossiella limnaea]|uniref:Uncharacterized protein n=1 Tax=Urbifossiella limnaea TaxID=2528023 RepID=A0A517Y203_9BACT|nr:hypothetical protein [Urbifossiella limnaea]QDU23764.1 hypothetical protein ETAA1_57710 [Urbifossiella limnaea]